MFVPIKIQETKISQAGFTLVEMMVVMILVAILFTLGASSFRGAQIKSRDSKRKADLANIAKSLDYYYNDHRSYPKFEGHGLVNDQGELIDWGTPFVDSKGTLYMTVLPKDPQRNRNYYYHGDQNSYQLFANLENDQDPHSLPAGRFFQGTDCGGAECNFAVSSSNIRPSDYHPIVEH